jgi:predicted GIY-YIG superfamily endonuclease
MATTTKPAYTPKNAADLLTPAIIAAGPAVVTLFTEYVNTANAQHAHKATIKHVQAAYKAYFQAFTAATQPDPDEPPPSSGSLSPEALLDADLEAYDAFNAVVAASAPDPQPEECQPEPEPPPPAALKRRARFQTPRRPSYIYLLHFSSPVAHARHYLGSTEDVERRLAEHRNPGTPGHYQGARLTQVAVIRGAELELVRTWRGGRFKERAMKQAYQHAFTSLCPLCTPGAGSKKARTFKP